MTAPSLASSPARPAGAYRTHLALAVVQIAFASQAVEGKIVMSPSALGGEAVAPVALAMTRMAGAALFFLVVTRVARPGRAASWRTRTPTTARDHLALAGLSVLGIVLNQTLFLLGLRLTTPVSAALLSVTIPVFTAALAVLSRVERPSARLGVGLVLALFGVLWLVGVRSVDRGALLVSINAVCYSTYIVSARSVIRRLGALTVVTWIFVWGALLFAPVGAPALVRDVVHWSPRAWAFVAYILLMPTIVAYSCNAWALGRSSPTLVTIYIYAQPVLAALLAWVQLGQPLSARLAFAAALILAGVGVVATRPARASSPSPRTSPRG